MKKNDWLLLLAVAIYSYLFYAQTDGLNYLLFTIILLLLTFVKSEKAVLANVVSLVLFAGFVRVPQASIFVAALNSVYSLGTSAFLNTFNKTSTTGQSRQALHFANFNARSIPVIGLPVLIFLIFLGLYQSASPAFSQLVGYINFDFISWYWVWFTFLGFWLLFGFFRQLILPELTQHDLAKNNTLLRVRRQLNKPFKFLGLRHEHRSAYLLLLLLNGLLLLFNISDAYYLFADSLPDGLRYSDYLHQGVNTLIFSFVLAIAILLYLFRGNLNFFSQNKTLKILAYTWLLQNLILVIITISKNSIYIQGTGLTYKRIGVYIYLLLTAIGLITNFIKIYGVKNNWFLFRKNAWGFYFVLLLGSSFSWDRILTDYNLKYAANPDVAYLTTLSDANLNQIYANAASTQNIFSSELKELITLRRQQFLTRVADKDWQSWNYSDWHVQQSLAGSGSLPK